MTEQYVEQEGRTTEEAMELALQKLRATRDQVRVTVLSEGKTSLFGLISKPAKVRVSLKEDPSSTPEGILRILLDEMGIESEIKMINPWHSSELILPPTNESASRMMESQPPFFNW